MAMNQSRNKTPSNQKDHKQNPKSTLLFIVLSVALMLVIHFLTNGGWYTGYMGEGREDKTPQFYTEFKHDAYGTAAPVLADLPKEDVEEIALAYGPDPASVNVENVDNIVPESKKITVKTPPEYEPLRVSGSPKIAIIIDDMGVDRKHSQQVIDIDAALTLAFLPYAEKLEDITKRARDNGHELIIHMPMQAMSAPVSLGPIALKTGMDEAAIKVNMQAALESFDGYVGLNNHMGSKVTQDPLIMNWVMETLKGKGLYFVDSKTISSSVAAETARLNGLPTAERDVFLDHEATDDFVKNALSKVEAVAANKGYAIAIGHPKSVTIEGLKKWIPAARARGFEIVHASALVQHPSPHRAVVSQSNPQEESVVATTQPAAGGISGGDLIGDDPNSAEARAAILKKMLGQPEFY